MAAEAVNFFLHGFLKTFHDEEGNDRCSEAYGDADNRDLVDGRGESFLVPATNSSGYKVG